MIPVHCLTKTDAETGTVGDCLRACVASIMELPALDVPHFYEDDCDGDEGLHRVRSWLGDRGLSLFRSCYDGSLTPEAIREFVAAANPDIHYMLSGRTASGGNHVVVCLNDAVEYDPAWVSSPIVAPADEAGYWIIDVIVRR